MSNGQISCRLFESKDLGIYAEAAENILEDNRRTKLWNGYLPAAFAARELQCGRSITYAWGDPVAVGYQDPWSSGAATRRRSPLGKPRRLPWRRNAWRNHPPAGPLKQMKARPPSYTTPFPPDSLPEAVPLFAFAIPSLHLRHHTASKWSRTWDVVVYRGKREEVKEEEVEERGCALKERMLAGKITRTQPGSPGNLPMKSSLRGICSQYRRLSKFLFYEICFSGAQRGSVEFRCATRIEAFSGLDAEKGETSKC